MANFPKILILSSYNLSGNCASDITIRSIFNHWPKSKLLIVTTSRPNETYANTIFLCEKTLRNIRKQALSALFRNSESSRHIVPGAIVASKQNRTSIRSKVFSIGASYADMISLRVSSNAIEQIREFRPDAIYTTLGNIRFLDLAIRLSRILNVKVIPHFMDDWPSIRYTGSFLFFLPRITLLKAIERLMSQLDFGLCISEKMCSEYEKRYHKRFFQLMNLVPDVYLINKKNVQRNIGNCITLTYFGGLHLNRWKTIINIDKAISSINIDHSLRVNLVIFTSKEDRIKYSDKFSNNVFFNDEIKHEVVFETMCASDYLIHIESFDQDVLPFIKYSISTKIPEYLASRKPIIAIGPIDAASIGYLKSNNCAYITITDKIELIKQTILEAIKGLNNKQYQFNSSKIVLRNHSKNYMLKLLGNFCKVESNAY